MPDNHLKEVASEIEAVLKKHDVAGVISLCSATHLEFLFHLTPTWACITKEEGVGGDMIHIKSRCKSADTEEQIASEKLKLQNAVGLIFGLIDVTRSNLEQLENLQKAISEQIKEIRHITRSE